MFSEVDAPFVGVGSAGFSGGETLSAGGFGIGLSPPLAIPPSLLSFEVLSLLGCSLLSVLVAESAGFGAGTGTGTGTAEGLGEEAGLGTGAGTGAGLAAGLGAGAGTGAGFGAGDDSAGLLSLLSLFPEVVPEPPAPFPSLTISQRRHLWSPEPPDVPAFPADSPELLLLLPPAVPAFPADSLSSLPLALPAFPADSLSSLPPALPAFPADSLSSLPPALPAFPADSLSLLPPPPCTCKMISAFLHPIR